MDNLSIGSRAMFQPVFSVKGIIGVIEIYMGNGLYLLHTGQVVHYDWFQEYLYDE